MRVNDDIELTLSGIRGTATVTIDATNGGRIVQIDLDGIQLLIPSPAIESRDSTSVTWGSYPMAPWAGRVRDGRFTFFGVDHELQLNQDDSGNGAPGRQHAMHGTVMSRAWTVVEQTATSVELSAPLDQPHSGWVLGGIARQRLEVFDGQIRCELSVSVGPDGAPVPAEVGWHPWWNKPDRLTFHPDAMYERDSLGLPTGRLVAPSDSPWDDCFINTAPVTLHYDQPTHPDITLRSDCDHWVVFDGPLHATCVEAQSGPPDAFNVRPRLVTARRPLRRSMTINWSSPAHAGATSC
ncbi:aldose epimerase [uncultured Ilumatobacter sp.]|jgi:aldose 1-epimerase|uniref:aldose epimerase family protein n=1 Tax=uncultured Ilumatobacter sp. TaxID=879968 RepID=UPI00374F710E